MAAHSGGVDWASVIKPLLNSGSLSKNDLNNLTKTILKCENEILEHDSSFDVFYMSFAALAANNISGQCNALCQNQILQITEACGVLIRYILNKFEKSSNSDTKILLHALKSLCEGKSQDQDFDQIIFSSILRNAKYPEHKSNVTGSSEKDSPKSEMKRSRSDLLTVILQQLSTSIGNTNAASWNPLSEEVADCTQVFTRTNIAFMQANNAGDIILKVCSSLPVLSRYYARYEDSAIHGKPLHLPVTHTDAMAIKSVLPQISSDISLLSLAISLPILEPLTPNKIKQLSKCAMAALYCAVQTSISSSVLTMTGTGSQKSQQQPTSENKVSSTTGMPSSASSKENEEILSSEDHARNIVDKALEIFTAVETIFNTTRYHVYLNHLCMGSWLLINGMQGAMGASGSSNTKILIASALAQDEPSKTKTPTASVTGATSRTSDVQVSSGRVNLSKVQQGFGVLNAAIASHCLTLLNELIEDLKLESRAGDDDPNADKIEPCGFDILGQYTTLQRIARVLNCATMQQLLTFLATVSYRKACSLKRINIKSEGDAVSFSDSTTYFNDSMSCSEYSDTEEEEEDSESYLGTWFKETLSPEGKDEATENTDNKSSENQRNSTSMVPAKDEPHEYLELSAQIFSFLDTTLGSNHKYLNKYVKSGLSEQQMALLANILKDLDRDAFRGEAENAYSTQWQNAMIEFSGAIGRYLHNLISGSLINESLQSSLLLHLGVSPWTQETVWPLQVYPRTLSVLVQILLLKPSQEKEAACLSVWHRLVNTLVDGVCSSQTLQIDSGTDYEDLNVEHAQLLLFLFHSLNLMQKKSILLLTAGGVIRCAEVCRTMTTEKPLRDHQIILLSRLLLFLEYLMKHLYNAPTPLLEQVRWNLFSTIANETTHQKPSENIGSKSKLISFCRKDIEDKYRKYSHEYVSGGVRPKFYSLSVIDPKLQEFKLDGLAWNFILCTPDKLKYPLLIDALIDILAITDICTTKINYTTICSVQYCFSLCWKLLLGLPPSTPHVEALMQEKVPNLHSLMWSVRCLHPINNSHALIVNSLIKQGMYTQSAEQLWKKITEHISDTKYSIKQTTSGLDSFIKTFQIANPRLSKIITLDAIVSHLVAIYSTNENGGRLGSDHGSKSGSNTSSGANSSDSGSIAEISMSSTSGSDVSVIILSGTESKSIEKVTPIDEDAPSKDLIVKLLDALEIVKECIFKTMSGSLNGTIQPHILESLIALSGSKHPYWKELAPKFTSMFTGQDKDVILVEWKKNLPILSEENISSSAFPVELHTLTVIEAHLGELSKHAAYSILLSIKHTAKSICNLIQKLVSVYKYDNAIEERIQNVLVPMLFDVRTEYLYDVSKQCLQTMINGGGASSSCDTDIFKMLASPMIHILKVSYRLLIDSTELAAQANPTGNPLDESILQQILCFWETMLTNEPMGVNAMHNFFHETKQGSLVHVLLSFTNTTFSQAYATKVLQFFENLFKAAEKPESAFKIEELCVCISELATVENGRLKNWLSHILLGPSSGSGLFSVSSVSSNVATPTNMATTSAAIPSISDQILPIDNDAMDIDYECTNAPVLLDYVVSEPTKTDDFAEKNGRLLQTLTKYIVSESRIAPNVSAALFQALIQLGQNLLCPAQEAPDFTDLLQVMITLADTSQGKGHSMLFNSSVDWLDISKSHILEKLNSDTKQAQNKTVNAFENVSALLKYMVDLLEGLGYSGNRAIATLWEDETQAEFDDYLDDLLNEDDDSAVEDSDEDSLSNKLCTYSISQKDFINQHWYHCHTCKMVEKAGVCSVCARVCHKNHDISYAKYGNFFCDCGAKEDGSCQALNKRSTYQDSSLVMGMGSSNMANENDFTSTIRRRTVTPPSRTHSLRDSNRDSDKATKLTEMIESSRDMLKTSDKWRAVVKCLLDFFEYLMPAIQENCAKYSTVGCQLRAKNAIERLHQPNKSFSISDSLMNATLGSQEGAFENVRMNYSGEQGQTIRQLLSTNLVRRVALCCLSSPHGKRQHLAVSHEKGKVTILQLSALLKQADAAKRKLTLSRLSSAPIPCIVLSLASNPANEDYLAVCGLKECHVLTFSNSGAVNDHIVLTPQLETANFIKRAMWLPGSQTKLAIVTADFVKIYELAEDTISPQYYFVVPSGKIRDCTFICQQDSYYMILFASSGYIYIQPLADESLAKHGAFYITNTLELDHPLIKDSNGLVGGGGVSIYYSHVLQLLFFSYSQGKSFMAPITDINEGVKCVIQLQTGPNSKNSSKIPPQPLCQWTEIPGHPGLICAMMQTSNNPVIFMLRPDSIVMQEIKAQNSKSKIMDMVAIRHASSGVEKTTLLLLCEDGSLRIYSANAENTNYWLQSEVQPVGNQLYSPLISKPSKKNKKSASKISQNLSGKPSSGMSNSPPTFPVDFFEHCNCLSDIEFGGNDLLQIYNTAQLKHRLNAQGLFVTSTRVNGFTLEITNNDQNMVIVGIRVSIGGQDPLRTPQSVTILGRTINTVTTKARWFDIPMTREESLQSDKKLNVQFGPSADGDNICMLDSIKVYGKTKDVFGWPEESDDNATTVANPMSNIVPNTNNSDVLANQITPLDKMMTSMLEVLDCGLSLLGSSLEENIRQKSMNVATKLLLHPLPNTVQTQAKGVLANLFANKLAYNAYKDKEILSEVNSELEKLKKVRDVRNIDPESFYRLVLLTRNIAVARPQSLAKIANENQFPIVSSFMQLLHELHAITPTYEAQCSIVRVGLSHTESIVHALVEIIYAFALSDPSLIEPMTIYLVKLLVNPVTIISYSVKQAMIRLLRIRIKRRKMVSSTPPICSTPTPSTSQQAIASNFPTTSSNENAPIAPSRPYNPEVAAAAAALNEEFAGMQEVDVIEPLGLEPAAGNAQVLASVEALLGGLRGFPQIVEMQQDGDEEAIMDIAIALSLQEQDGHLETLQQGLANIQGAGNRALQSLHALNVSAGGASFNNEPAASVGSDDESASNATDAATDGSTLRTPAEPAGSSESGGSGIESIGGASGRSSTCDQMHSSPPRSTEMIQPEPSTSNANVQEEIREEDSEDNNEAEIIHKLHVLRVSILQRMVDNIPILDGANGEQSIPFMQVILMLTSDLDGEQESDQTVMQKLLTALIDRLEISQSSQPPDLTTRSAKTEVKLVILRLLCVLMGKVKSSSKMSISTLVPSSQKDNATFVASTTANALLESGCIQFCLIMLKSFLPYWKNASVNEDNGISVLSPTGLVASQQTSAVTGAISNLLKPRQYGPEPDMAPFFSPLCLKGCADVFELYPTVLTEMSVRLPYQILKLSTNHAPSYEWYSSVCEYLTYTLCEYMMIVQSAILRRLVRKLLLYICGSKEKYRQIRDIHSLDSHIKIIQKSSETASTQLNNVQNANSVFTYDSLVELTEHLRACHEVATLRTGNWQRFCLSHVYVLPSLLRTCLLLDEGVSPIILQLLQSAVCNTSTFNENKPETKQVMMKVVRQDRERSEESECSADSKFDPSQCAILVTQIFSQTSAQLFTKFIKIFLLETNITSIRWQAHGLLYAFYENSNTQQRERLLNCMWELWSLLPEYGRRTAQFVDLLGYLTLSTKHIDAKLPEYMGLAVSVLRQQNEFLSKHPNAPIYTALSHVLELDGYFLESEPCLVCNCPEVPMTNIKLSSIKIDSKFTTTTTIVKLVQSHTISKIILRIGDLKRTKMVRTINIYYNNRSVQAVVELKNRPSMWHKAKKVNLSSGQTDVKIEFPLPITACNLMIEYADFYETVTSSSESLQCPRCSAAVAANPGVCGNCGENVYQCHKCRAINYDEKDPFLCHSCGFCKYAKFDYSLYGRACCAVDPIESAEDRAKTVQTINVSLEKADRIYRTLQGVKQILELLVQKVAEHKFDRVVDENMIGNIVSSSQVNKVIQLLAQKYCVESKTSFEELSKIIQKVQACRRELVAYDRSQIDSLVTSTSGDSQIESIKASKPTNCFGCALASTEQCLTLLRAMAVNMECRTGLCKQGLVEELAQNNLRRGTTQIQDEVRNLLCLLTKELPDPTQNLCDLIHNRVKLALSGIIPLANIDTAVRHEMALLESLVSQNDSCWEQKLRVVLEIFLMACRDARGPPAAILQPSLRILENLIAPKTIPTKQPSDDGYVVKVPSDGLTVNAKKWLQGDKMHSYDAWKNRMPQTREKYDSIQLEPQPTAEQKSLRSFISILEEKRRNDHYKFLSEKYGRIWRRKALLKSFRPRDLKLTASWLQPILFNSNSRMARQLACALIPSLINKTHERKKEMLDLLTSFLKYIGEAGEASEEFLILYRCLAEDTPWREYLVLKGVLTHIADLLKIEIEKIHRLEETTLSSDLAQGYALRQLVELLAMFLDKPKIRQVYKGKLLGPVLQGYLSLRRLVVQRTRLVDDAQEKLLEMLEEMTTGTEEETRAFMSVLIDTVSDTPLNDIKTPVFIFERLCSIIHPEENDVGEFFLTLEKDPQQEDFLQGRMLGNPYPSTEAGLGPLMRDVKNKICTDCELVALLEDDNGMELLVQNKIISLDLPVKEVYKKVWLTEGGERDTMRIVYRMRGLLGDATEEFIETLNNKTTEEVDNEALYRMANVLADCGGLKVMLDRIGSLTNVTRSRQLLQVLLKLFLLAVKVRRCQEVLCQPELNAINTLLKVLQMCLQSDSDSQQSAVTEQLLEIMETILSKAASDTLDSFLQFSLTFGGPEYVTALIFCTNCANVRNNPSVLRHLIRVLAALVYGNDLKMALLCEHFKNTLDFYKYDTEHITEDEFKMELFCVLTNQIEHNSIGGTLKDYIMGLGIVDKALEYITSNAPCVKPTLLRTDSDELKEFISKPSLKYILRFLTGLATKHEATQVAVSKDIIPIIHRLEQVSSDEHVGSLAENLLEALCTDAGTAQRVQEVRDFTRAEKKRLAMATREKQLDALGMRTNEKGQVTAKGSILQKIEKLREETGLTCFICREGYACQPSKVLGIYTFTKRTNVEEFELKARKTTGYTTVTHFNVVHVDCHTSAIRNLGRGRDEWEMASLQNANTKCNGLLPLFGPDISEINFQNSISRHNAYMLESTQRCEISFANNMHDLKMLLMRFAFEKSFHEDCGGGGPQSNGAFLPYLLQYSIYTLLSSRSTHEKALSTYLEQPVSDWLASAYEVEGPLFQVTCSMALHSPTLWNRHRIQHLKRLLVIAQARHCSRNVACKTLSGSDRQAKEYLVYKPYLMTWSMVDLVYCTMFKTVNTPKPEDWPISLFDFIRRNDEALMKSTESVLEAFTVEHLPCTSFGEFCDVAGLLNDIENPDEFLNELIQSLP